MSTDRTIRVPGNFYFEVGTEFQRVTLMSFRLQEFFFEKANILPDTESMLLT